MKKLFLSILLIFSIDLMANEHIAIVKEIKGDVSTKHLAKLEKSFLGEKLYQKDIITTGKDGTVSIVFNDGSVLNLASNSLLSIDDFVFEPAKNDFNFNLNLKKGKGVFESGKIGKLAPDSFQMKFPQGIVGIRGTKFLIEVQ